MNRRSTTALLILAALIIDFSAPVVAHEGHDHKVLGTVTMAASDHLMLKDRDGKDVTILVTRDTKVIAKQPTKVEDIEPGTRVVVTATMEKNQTTAKTIEVGVATPGGK